MTKGRQMPPKRVKVRIRPPEVWDILSIIGDEKSQRLFIKLVRGEVDKPGQEKGYTRKQYYTRLQRFKEYGLLRKRGIGSVYWPTTLGTIVFDELQYMREVMRNWTELKMMDAIDDMPWMPVHEKEKIWKKLLDPSLLRKFVPE